MAKKKRNSAGQLVDKQSPAKSSFKLQGSPIALKRDDKGGCFEAMPTCEWRHRRKNNLAGSRYLAARVSGAEICCWLCDLQVRIAAPLAFGSQVEGAAVPRINVYPPAAFCNGLLRDGGLLA